ncbi:PTS sugar transporter subunit IIA [Atopobium sp. oral taxon 810]|uniref:PTS sugar transporter subunit IIA n=1 Tax=Atopobium sp. oral taxon 810 TaxID=712158 RepID=UPI000397E5E5|nr:PTS sugar transporter subunit IIA [Atopobium sp. oral taxon 810]ERI06579.1 PTS system fructose IIA component [Atopobium sp. oral taxon 810 str. F0209]
MIGILICGHGHFATGILSSLELIMGKQEDIWAIDFPCHSSKAELEDTYDCVLASMADCEHVIIFTDLFAGSPFNVAMEHTLADPERISLYFGLNLGMLIDTVNHRMLGETFEQIDGVIVETGKQQVGKFLPEQFDMGVDKDDGGDL